MFTVLANHEAQYAIWPAGKVIPAGWTAVGSPASKEACLDRIRQAWTDPRPLSLRQKDAARACPR